MINSKTQKRCLAMFARHSAISAVPSCLNMASDLMSKAKYRATNRIEMDKSKVILSKVEATRNALRSLVC